MCVFCLSLSKGCSPKPCSRLVNTTEQHREPTHFGHKGSSGPMKYMIQLLTQPTGGWTLLSYPRAKIRPFELMGEWHAGPGLPLRSPSSQANMCSAPGWKRHMRKDPSHPPVMEILDSRFVPFMQVFSHLLGTQTKNRKTTPFAGTPPPQKKILLGATLPPPPNKKKPRRASCGSPKRRTHTHTPHQLR